jgi:hypothetical protein
MVFTQRTRLSPRLAAGGLAAFALAGCISALAGERIPLREQIQFSKPGEAVDLLTSHPKDDPQSKQFEFLDRGNSVSGVVAPFDTPATGAAQNHPRNARLLFEAFDRKKNWIYGRSEDLDRTTTPASAFDRGDFGESSTKPKTVLEGFLEHHGERPSLNRARDEAGDWPRVDSKMDFSSGFDQNNRLATDARPRLGNAMDPARTMTAGFSLPGEFFGTSRGQEPLSNFQTPRRNESPSNARGGRNAIASLLAVPGSINPLVPGFNPLNLSLDAPVQVLNPVPAQNAAELPGTSRDALNPFRFIGPTEHHSSVLVTDPSAQILSPSSLSPVVAAPTESTYVQPKPIVLEIPRRKF